MVKLVNRRCFVALSYYGLNAYIVSCMIGPCQTAGEFTAKLIAVIIAQGRDKQPFRSRPEFILPINSGIVYFSFIISIMNDMIICEESIMNDVTVA